MAPEKAPAFQFYPKDYLSDLRVKAMSFEQRGLYWDAVSICWIEGTLPTDTTELAAILGCPLKRFNTLWPRIVLCFQEHGGRLTHKRLDKERKAQSESRDRRAAAARTRWDKEHSADALHMQSTASEPPLADAMQCSPSSSASSSPTASSSASSTAVKEERATALITSPLAYDKRKAQCVFVGSRLEVPHGLHSDLRKLLGGADADSELQAWYHDLNTEIEESGEAITPDVFRWLKARYAKWRQASGEDQREQKRQQGRAWIQQVMADREKPS